MNSGHSENSYRPISCASYDTYEIAIVRRQRLHLVWDEDNVVYDQVVTPLSLRTVDGAEYLNLCTVDGNTREVRLDRIRRAQPV